MPCQAIPLGPEGGSWARCPGLPSPHLQHWPKNSLQRWTQTLFWCFYWQFEYNLRHSGQIPLYKFQRKIKILLQRFYFYSFDLVTFDYTFHGQACSFRVVYDFHFFTEAVFPLQLVSVFYSGRGWRKGHHQERSRALETSIYCAWSHKSKPCSGFAHPTQHANSEGNNQDSVTKPKSYRGYKIPGAPCERGAVWFVLLGRCEKLPAGIVSNVPSLIPAPGTCEPMPRDLPFSLAHRYWLSVPSLWSLRLCDMSLAALGSHWGGWIFGQSEAKWGWLKPLCMPHPILSWDQPLREKADQAGLSLGGWLGTEGQRSLVNVLRSFLLSCSKDFWCYVYKEKPEKTDDENQRQGL